MRRQRDVVGIIRTSLEDTVREAIWTMAKRNNDFARESREGPDAHQARPPGDPFQRSLALLTAGTRIISGLEAAYGREQARPDRSVHAAETRAARDLGQGPHRLK